MSEPREADGPCELLESQVCPKTTDRSPTDRGDFRIRDCRHQQVGVRSNGVNRLSQAGA